MAISAASEPARSSGDDQAVALLEQLIAQGLAKLNQDLTKIRQLIAILFQACVMLPFDPSASPARFQRARDTLTIIRQQADAHSELLLQRPDPDQEQVPLYKHLLPRLLFIADRSRRLYGSSSLSWDAVRTAMHLLRCLCRDVPDDSADYSRNRQRSSVLLKAFKIFIQAGVDDRPAVLYGCTDLVPSRMSALLAIQICITSEIPFAAAQTIGLDHLLSLLARRVSDSERPLFGDVMESLMPIAAPPHFLVGPLSAMMEWPDTWTPSKTLLSSMAVRPDLATMMWWRLTKRRTQLVIESPADAACVEFLVSPHVNHINEDLIDEVLGDVLRDWARRLSLKDECSLAVRNALSAAPTSTDARESAARRIMAPLQFDASKDVRQLATHTQQLDSLQRTCLARNLGQLCCILANCDDHQPPFRLDHTLGELWIWCAKDTALEADLMISLPKILDHTPELSGSVFASLLGAVGRGLAHKSFKLRKIAALALSALFRTACRAGNKAMCKRVISQLDRPDLSLPMRATFVQTIGAVAKSAGEDTLGVLLEMLFRALGDDHPPVVSMASAELLSVARHREKTPYTLVLPHLERLSILCASNLIKNQKLVGEALRIISVSRMTFFEITLSFTIPALVVGRETKALSELAKIVKQQLALMLIDYAAPSLTKIFMSSKTTDSSLAFLIHLLKSPSDTGGTITAHSLMTSCNVAFVGALVVELGDEDSAIRSNALLGLNNAQKIMGGSSDLGAFLKPLMLGIISTLNDALHDMQGKKSVAFKQKVIRSIGALIETVGDSISVYAPQIIASLQGTLGIPELRSVTLAAWRTFIIRLRFNDSGPFIGRTTAALTAHWKDFDDADKRCAVEIITDIAGNAPSLSLFLEEIVDMSHIPELNAASTALMQHRQTWSFQRTIERLLDRIGSRNPAVSLTAMAELRATLSTNTAPLAKLAKGDSFDPLATRILHGLLSAAIGDADNEELRVLTCECLGIVGALDPDRLAKLPDQRAVLIMNNFNDKEEAMEFALHLVRDVLVDAFRATNDTKHQNHLAYAIQELLGFCDFSSKMMTSNSSVSLAVKAKWNKFPKDQHETLAPLLESRFLLTDLSIREYRFAIYPNAATYREWVQMWSTALVGSVMKSHGNSHSQAIFGVMRGVLRNQDVTVAHHILPHLVLHLLLSGDSETHQIIATEINCVLQDQVSSIGSLDKRTLSAQVIFDLMDHLSRWLRSARTSRVDRNFNYKTVESVLSSVETELLANAAMQSKAYARSLRAFESRIISHKMASRDNSELQIYYERLHEIYAHLDEPDGMEGVSAFVISPSLEHQIREHESTGRWTSAQSCWEVRLQQRPEDLSLHERLLRCLRNLGHYDTLQTHIRGVLSQHPEWASPLAAFSAEAAWLTGDWSTVEEIAETGLPMAKVMAGARRGCVQQVLRDARLAIGQQITSTSYQRSYDTILQLQIIREIEEICTIGGKDVVDSLNRRFENTAPAFRTREAVLSARRTAFSLTTDSAMRRQIGRSWILSSKLARKAGYEQTAYSAILQAREIEAPFAFVQQAKLTRKDGGALRALSDLDNALELLCRFVPGRSTEIQTEEDASERFSEDRNMAKAFLLHARWTHETGRFPANDVILRFARAIELGSDLESPYYHLGHYYDNSGGTPDQRVQANLFTCHNYTLALQNGVKYIYRTMPRTLTIWLDLAEVVTGKSKDKKNPPSHEAIKSLDRITSLMQRCRKDLPAYQFLTAFPQIASRIGHKSEKVQMVLPGIMVTVVMQFPLQALWPIVYLLQSKRSERKEQCSAITQKAAVRSAQVAGLVHDATRLSGGLLRLADEKVEDKKREASVRNHYSYMRDCFPSKMMMPLQDALNGSLPSSAENVKSHMPFSTPPVTIRDLDDKVEIMSSLQQPKKLVFIGNDAKRYPFLCKPHDDLRKDARLMDFNSMINKLLKSASESRRRQLYIRTYAVMPLNEECGLLEWVSNTNALKNILEKGYHRHNKKVYSSDLHRMLEEGRKLGSAGQIQVFKRKILPLFNPTVFNEWFLSTWPEPSAWLSSRMNYSRTLAVMSMIGYVLGLGDRHGENILFDGLSGDTVHVDLNCLFDKGKTFEIPERVPFRLTQNMIDAMGVTGVEGVFRKAAEITLYILRSNSESLMSVLEAFVHDPLVEWTKMSSKGKTEKTEKDIRASADKNLKPIQLKLKGVMTEGFVTTISNQVETLIEQAASPENLALMYQGWAPWL